jgi:BASS family bile acid:Na+ symporter
VEWISDVLLPGAMFGLMFGMGLTLSLRDFRNIALAPTATVLGTLLQLVAMPAAGIGIALASGLPPLLAAGLVVIAACPGGMFSNMYVHLGRANTALSITLTATATMATLFTLPLWLRVILDQVGDGAIDVEVPVLETALRLGGLTVLPVLVGMAVRSRRPGAHGAEKWLSRGSALVIVGAMVVDGMQRPELPIAEFQQSLLPAIWLAAAAVVLGLGGPVLLRLPSRDAATIGVELVVKNMLLGLVLARQSLDFEATIPIFAFATFQTPIGVLVLVGWRVLARYGVVAGPLVPPSPASVHLDR